jgi:UDP-N-acetylmuramoyl-tripeptide--D-alanyl-D-alanine ligase
MEARDMNWVALASGGKFRSGSAAAPVLRVSTDSRTAGPGDLFVALRGERFDAHDFLPEVVARGVAGVLVAEGCEPRATGNAAVVTVPDTRVGLGRMAAKYRSEYPLPVVCVVGSNGKTTTKDLLAALVAGLGPVHRSEASFNNDVGVPLTLLGLGAGHRVAVLEAGTNHPGELAPLLASIAPKVGVLTGIGREHLEHFGSLEGVAAEEGTIASVLPADGLLVMNGDGDFADGIAARCRAEVVRFGEGVGNAWRVVSSRSTWEGQEFELASPVTGWSGLWRVGVPGRHMAVNAAGALAAACRLGVSVEPARTALAGFRATKQRLEVLEAGGVRILNDCYNANADSMAAALQTLFDLPCAGRRVAVLGDMAELGPASEPAHGEVGMLAVGRVDMLFAVGQRAGVTAGAAAAAGMDGVSAHADVESLLPVLLEAVRPGDVVLIKASRSARLERVTAGLLARLGERKVS